MKRLTAILILFLGMYANAQNDIEEAIALHNRREYDQAAALFEKIAEQYPENTNVYFNLGNSYRKLNQNGNAIWAYQKVLKRNPSDQESAENIQTCRASLGLTDSPFQVASQFERAIVVVGLSTWTYLSLALAFILGLCLFFLLRKKDFSRLPVIRFIGYATIPLLCFTIFSAYTLQTYLETKTYGIITRKSAPVFVNDLGERSTMSLPEGTMVKFESLHKTKTSVTLKNGKQVLLSERDIRWI
jgi:tetratricopeptide (TPR) repeat protein